MPSYAVQWKTNKRTPFSHSLQLKYGTESEASAELRKKFNVGADETIIIMKLVKS